MSADSANNIITDQPLDAATDDDVLPIAVDDEAAVLALNNAHAVELSWLEMERLRFLLARAFHARRIGRVEAFLIAFDETSDYDGGHFQWFRARYPRFVYVDRVVVAPAARGRGHARRLYLDLFDRARRSGHDVVTCEVNAEPPNPASDAFHAAMGFAPVGSASHNDKAVRYFVHRLG